MARRLYRSIVDSKIAGVCGGLAEYFDIDPVIVRISAVLITLASFGVGFLGYIIAWIAIQPNPNPIARAAAASATTTTTTVPPPIPNHESSTWRYLPGLILILLGGVLLIRHFVWWFSLHAFWPLLLILLGLFLLLRKSHRDGDAPTGTYTSPEARNGGATL